VPAAKAAGMVFGGSLTAYWPNDDIRIHQHSIAAIAFGY
jgi:hypothetical protein